MDCVTTKFERSVGDRPDAQLLEASWTATYVSGVVRGFEGGGVSVLGLLKSPCVGERT